MVGCSVGTLRLLHSDIESFELRIGVAEVVEDCLFESRAQDLVGHFPDRDLYSWFDRH